MSNECLRQLKIKTASVHRIRKELAFYEEDAVREQKRFEKLKADGVDHHDLQQAVCSAPPCHLRSRNGCL